MSDKPLKVAILAGPLDAARGDEIRALADRLRTCGAQARVYCAGRAERAEARSDIAEWPGLAKRWRRPWTVRRLPFGTDAERPDVLHVLGLELAGIGVALAEHWALPYVVSLDDFLPPGARLRVSRAWCRRIVTSGQELANELLGEFGVPEHWIEVIPPGIAVPEPRNDARDPARVPVIGSAGTLGARGGLAVFLEAAQRVVAAGIDAEFVVNDLGPDEAQVRRLAAHLGIAERLTYAEEGVCSRAFWRVLDVFCQASLVSCAGRSVARALAFGVPAVVSDVAGLRAWVGGGELGLLVPRGDADALAQVIIQLLDDPPAAAERASRARDEIARQCDPAREAQALAALYRSALNEADRASVYFPRPHINLAG